MNNILVNGNVVDKSKGILSIYSPSIRYGIIVFEALRLNYDENKGQYVIFRVNDHLDRLLFSCKLLGLKVKYTKEELKNMIEKLVKTNNSKKTMGIRVFVYYENEESFTTNVDATVSMCLLDIKGIKDYTEAKLMITDYNKSINGMLPYGVKSSAHYAYSRIAVLKAQKCGFDDVIFLNTQGHVTECSRASLFIVKDNVLKLPKVSDGVLSSITRSTILSLKDKYNIAVEEGTLTREDLYKADEIFTAGTSLGVTPVKNIDGFDLPNVNGVMSRKVASIYTDLLLGKEILKDEWITVIK